MTTNEIATAVAAKMDETQKANIAKEKETHRAKVKAKKIKYPFQVASIKREKKVLGVDAKLFVPTENENVSPLELHSGYSRFELTIVDKENNTTPTANIPADEIPYIMETTKIALNHLLTSNRKASSGNTATSIAYTQKLIDKNFKGMTPAEVLLKDPSQVQNLLNAKKWLEQNVARFPANKSQITAIEEAISLLEKGELSADKTAENTSSNIEIYKTDYKFKTKKNEKGYNLIYGIEIICDPEKNYPFAITIMNCYAPVETTASGQKTIKMNVAENVAKSTLVMKKDEWYKFVSKMHRTLIMFETQHFGDLFNDSQIAGEY